MKYLNIAAFNECTISEGPGRRFALWVQGCKLRCPGCCNPQMQELVERNILSTLDLISLIEKSKRELNIEGITIMGGEPMLQAESLSEVVEWCAINNLTVMIFSGYWLDYLKSLNNSYIKKLLSYTDIFIDGPFVKDLYETKRNWIGSSNQKIYYFTDKYPKGLEYKNINRNIEFKIYNDKVEVNGWPFIIT